MRNHGYTGRSRPARDLPIQDDGRRSGGLIYSGIYPEEGVNKAARAYRTPMCAGGRSWPSTQHPIQTRGDPAASLVGAKKYSGGTGPEPCGRGTTCRTSRPPTDGFKSYGEGWHGGAGRRRPQHERWKHGSSRRGASPKAYADAYEPWGAGRERLYRGHPKKPRQDFTRGNRYIDPGDPAYPVVITTYRLTEHHTAGAMSRWLPWLASLMPELFVEISPELARERGIGNTDWATIVTPRGAIEAKALVTRRIRPFEVMGRTVHQIGMPWHWGYRGVVTGAATNTLSALVADPNVTIHESKAFMCTSGPAGRPGSSRPGWIRGSPGPHWAGRASGRRGEHRYGDRARSGCSVAGRAGRARPTPGSILPLDYPRACPWLRDLHDTTLCIGASMPGRVPPVESAPAKDGGHTEMTAIPMTTPGI